MGSTPRRSLAAALLLGAVAVAAPAPVQGASLPEARTESTELSVTWPASETVRRGAAVTVTGEVDGGPRVVRLEHRSRQSGWEALRTTTAGDDGAFSLTVPTGWYTTHTLRVQAPATKTHEAGLSDTTRRLAVEPSYAPAGRSTSYLLSGFRWNPCRTIGYRVRGARLPSGALADVKQAVRLLSHATGLRFRYLGKSAQVPWRGQAREVRRADLLVGWATAGELPRLSGNVAGLGGVSSGVASAVAGQLLIGEAMVALDVDSHARPGFGTGWTRGELLLHELGHAVGLEHYFADPGQVMAYATRDHDRFGAGDLAGLRQVGRSAGCLVERASARLAGAAVLHPQPEPQRTVGPRPELG